jgi:hypothetical protein
MPSVEQIAKPIARAINIYCRVARRELDNELRRALARHIRTLANQGIEDADRLTVHGLSYLRRHEPRRRQPRRSKGSPH